jgi:hypothetical protein
MANRYGEGAIIAARQENVAISNPIARWKNAMERLYPTSPSAQKKGSAQGAFLGLCEEGLVKGIPAGSYAASKDNKANAVRAVTLLMEGTESRSRSALWRAVTDGAEVKEDSQIDVVLALWNNDLIVGKP